MTAIRSRTGAIEQPSGIVEQIVRWVVADLLDIGARGDHWRSAKVAGTSTTVSPAVTSCCARRNARPSAPSIALA